MPRKLLVGVALAFAALFALVLPFAAALAAESAADPVTWDQVAVIAAWVGGGLLLLIGLVVAGLILLALAGVFNDWSR